MFNNQANTTPNPQNNKPSTGLFASQSGLTQPKPAGSLFGGSTAGLFGTNSTGLGGGLFSSNNNSQLKTTERKQGGLFGSISTPQPASSQQAPKLLFGALNPAPANNPLFGGVPPVKKQQEKPSLFPNNPPNSLFPSTSPIGSGGLFGGSTSQNETKKQPQKSAQSKQPAFGGGLFAGMGEKKDPEDKSKQSKPVSMFGNVTVTPSSGGLFGNKTESKQQTKPESKPLFGALTSGPSIFGNNSSQPPVLFGGVNKKDQQKKQPQSLIPNALPSPNQTLFSKTSSSQVLKKPQQAPKFSLGGNASSFTNIKTTGGLFDNVKPLEQKPKQAQKAENTEKQPVRKQTAQTSLFGNIPTPTPTPTQQEKKPTVFSLFNSSTQTKKPDQPAKPPVLSGSLFGNSKPEDKKEQTPASPTVSLFNNKPQDQTVNKTQPQKQVQIRDILQSKIINTTAPLKESDGVNPLLQTFSKGQDEPTIKDKSRTISFNSGQGSPSQKKPAYSLFGNVAKPNNLNQTTTQASQLPAMSQKPKQAANTEIPQSMTKPTTSHSESVPVTTSVRPSQKSFFQSNVVPPKPQPSQTIYTFHEISKLIQDDQKREALDSRSSYAVERNQKNALKQIQDWMMVSFSRFNQIPTSEMLSKSFNLHQNQDIKRFLNDIIREVLLLVNLPLEQKQFKLLNKLFFELIDKLGIKQGLFVCKKPQEPSQGLSIDQPKLQIVSLNNNYFTRHQIYKFTTDRIHLHLQSQQLQSLIKQLVKKFLANQNDYLQYIERKPQLLKQPNVMFYHLLSYCLKYRKVLPVTAVWQEKAPELVQLIQDFGKITLTSITNMLSTFMDQQFYNLSLIAKNQLPNLILLLDNFSYVEESELIQLSLKSILNSIEIGFSSSHSSNKLDVQLTPEIKLLINKTQSLQLIPFRTLVSITENNNKATPSPHDLYRYIAGLQWLDWLEIYLSNGSGSSQKEVSIIEAKYLIKILKYPSLGTKRIQRESLTPKQVKYIQNLQKKILARKRPIYKFIMSLKDENMLDIFYEILMSLIYDYESYRRVEELFFRQKDEFNYEFKNVVAEICNYPTQKFKEEIPFIEEKFLYFLRIIEVAPERTLDLEKLIFEGTPIEHRKLLSKEDSLQKKVIRSDLGYSQVGHKICHLIIDAINYFGLKQNQRVVARCISAIKSLLQNENTSLEMKIAMSVNKPQMGFISKLTLSSQSRLSQGLITEITKLLELFLTSQQLLSTMGLNMRTNNSDDANLQRMYPVRYSNKDYLPFVKELISSQSSRPVHDVISQEQMFIQSNVIVTYSSYWILKGLEVLVHAFRQQSSVSSQTLLNLVSLILEKLVIPLSHQIQEPSQVKLQEQQTQIKNNPIYPTTASNAIPKVLLYMIQALNSIDLISFLTQNLKYKVIKSRQVTGKERKFEFFLANEKLQNNFEDNQSVVYFSMRILKLMLQVYRVYEQYKNSLTKQSAQDSLKYGQNHYVYKILTRLRCIQDLEFNLFLKGFSSGNLLQGQQPSQNINFVIGLIALLFINTNKQSPELDSINDRIQSDPINLKQRNSEKPFIRIDQGFTKQISSQISRRNQDFYAKTGETLNFECINNFLVPSTNPYLQSFESIQCLVIQSLSLLITGQSLFGSRCCNTEVESTINLVKYMGVYSVNEGFTEMFSNVWILESLQEQIYALLSSRHSSVQLKQAILNLFYHVIKSKKSLDNVNVVKKIFYKYLPQHVDELTYNRSSSLTVRLNLICTKILNLLQVNDYVTMRRFVKDSFLDNLLAFMLQNCLSNLKSQKDLVKLINSFKQHKYHTAEFDEHHLERTIEERELVQTGQVYELLREIIELIEKRFFDNGEDKHKWKCIRKVSSMVINLNLNFLLAVAQEAKLTRMSYTIIAYQQQRKGYTLNINLPRFFTKNPLENYLSEARTLSDVGRSFQVYKQNVVDWVGFYSISLREKASRLLNWVLTVDKTLYGNQPVTPKSQQMQAHNSQNIICSMHMGSYKLSAVELFAESQAQAINLVKNLYDQTLNKLKNELVSNHARSFSILGYCLQWINARRNTSEYLDHLVQNTVKDTFWLDQNTIKNGEVVKFLLSIANIGKDFMTPLEFKYVRNVVIDAIHKFRQGKSQVEEQLIQELLNVLISVRPLVEDKGFFQDVVDMWKTQTNDQYFYNQSRLLIELSMHFPNQIAALQPLRSCEKLRQASMFSQYNYSLRHPDALTMTWGLKLASVLMSSQIESVVILQQIQKFYQLKLEQIYNFLLRTPTGISLVYIEELQALLQFFLTLVSCQTWITVNRQQFQKLTYVLSHKLINVFSDFINSKINFVVESDMERKFKKIRFESINQLDQVLNAHEINLEKNSVFRILMEIKMAECMKTFTILLSRCFEQSWYVDKYFAEEVYENYRYGAPFWDRMNKWIVDLVRFNVNNEKKWRKCQHLNQKLLLVKDCVNSSEFFAESGYLSSFNWIPSDSSQLFEFLYEFNLFVFELGSVHLIQQKTCRLKYQFLMKGNIQKFGKKLAENVKTFETMLLTEHSKEIKTKQVQQKGKHMSNISKNIFNLIRNI